MLKEFEVQKISKDALQPLIERETAEWARKRSLIVFMDGVSVSRPSNQYLEIE
jgi:hypothetical protein